MMVGNWAAPFQKKGAKSPLVVDVADAVGVVRHVENAGHAAEGGAADANGEGVCGQWTEKVSCHEGQAEHMWRRKALPRTPAAPYISS
ncbi:hypothetical protein R1flu_007515 [Riccia fluitans]|uniref:Uncharacterized protein n=1 Tax=Riccia fluitans TaxID=41844 RepID=A0ABD1YZL3_9MARC